MKKMLLVMALIGLATGPVLAANDYVVVEFNGQKQRITKLDRKTMSVCALKAQVGAMFGLQSRKFDLKKKNGPKLRDDKTLEGAYINNGNTLTIAEVNYSSQCT